MTIQDSVMEVRGSALQTIPKGIIQKFGKDSLNIWLDTLSQEAKMVYNFPIKEKTWYPLKQILIEPMASLAKLFYNSDLEKAGLEFGKISVDLGLSGLKRLIFKVITPGIIISKAVDILPTYYRPSKLEVLKNTKGSAIFQIIHFPDIDKTTEYRIAGWMLGALEINKVKNPEVNITKLLSNNQSSTEYQLSWTP